MEGTSLSFADGNLREKGRPVRSDVTNERYRGDFWIEDTDRVEVSSDRKHVGPVTIVRQRSASNLHFRRADKHVRDDYVRLCVIWFVNRGVIEVSDGTHTEILHPNQFAITHSHDRFWMRCKVDPDTQHQTLRIIVPEYVMRKNVRHRASAGPLIMTKNAEIKIAEKMLWNVLDDDGRIADPSAHLLVDTALFLIGRAVDAPELVPVRPTTSERRHQDLLRFIEVHLCDPQLSPRMAAKGCGISPRYLSALMRMQGMPFSKLVWQKRLEKAKDYLAGKGASERSISEIAYGLGFKSTAHFSRMFKRTYKMTARDYRNEQRDVVRPEAVSELGTNSVF